MGGFVEYLLFMIVFVGALELVRLIGSRSFNGWKRISGDATGATTRSAQRRWSIKFRRSGRFGWLGFFLVAALICLYSAEYGYLIDPWAAFAYALSGGFLVAAFRQLYIGMDVDGQGLTVIRLFRTYRVRWVDLSEIAIDPGGKHSESAGPALVLRWRVGDRTRSVKCDEVSDEDEHELREEILGIQNVEAEDWQPGASTPSQRTQSSGRGIPREQFGAAGEGLAPSGTSDALIARVQDSIMPLERDYGPSAHSPANDSDTLSPQDDVPVAASVEEGPAPDHARIQVGKTRVKAKPDSLWIRVVEWVGGAAVIIGYLWLEYWADAMSGSWP